MPRQSFHNKIEISQREVVFLKNSSYDLLKPRTIKSIELLINSLDQFTMLIRIKSRPIERYGEIIISIPVTEDGVYSLLESVAGISVTKPWHYSFKIFNDVRLKVGEKAAEVSGRIEQVSRSRRIKVRIRCMIGFSVLYHDLERTFKI